MRVTVGSVLAALLVTLVLSATAGAFTLRFEPSGSVRLSSVGQLTFSDSLRTFNVACNVTLSGSLRSGTIAATAGTTFGELSESTVSGCSGGSISLLGVRERLWTFVYESETGELPDGMREFLYRLRGAAFLASVTISGTAVSCLYRGNVALHVVFTPVAEFEENPYTITRPTLTGNEIERVSGSELCPSRASVRGSLSFTAAQRVQVGPRFTWMPGSFNFGNVERGTSGSTMVITENTSGGPCTTESTSLGSVFRADGGRIFNGIFFGNNGQRQITMTFNSALPLGAKQGSISFGCNGLQAFNMQGTTI